MHIQQLGVTTAVATKDGKTKTQIQLPQSDKIITLTSNYGTPHTNYGSGC